MIPCQEYPDASYFTPTCEVHCKKRTGQSQCLATSALTPFFSEPVHHSNYEPCIATADFKFGFCNEKGFCQQVADPYQTGSINIIVLIVVILILLACLNVLICLYCRYCRGQTININNKP